LFDYLSNPYHQAVISCLLLLIVSIFTKLDVGAVLIAGASIGMVFLLSSLFYGVYLDKTWNYLLYALFAVVVFSVFWVLLALLANKVGQPIRNGEGWMILMMPATVFPVLFVFAAISKLVFDFIRSFI